MRAGNGFLDELDVHVPRKRLGCFTISKAFRFSTSFLSVSTGHRTRLTPDHILSRSFQYTPNSVLLNMARSFAYYHALTRVEMEDGGDGASVSSVNLYHQCLRAQGSSFFSTELCLACLQ